MALAGNFQTKQNIDIVWGSGNANLGTAHIAGSNWLRPKTLDFTMPEASTALEMGSPQNNLGVEVEDNAVHRLDTATWTFTQSVIAEDEVIKAIFKNFMADDTSPFALTGALGLDGSGGFSLDHGSATTIPNTVLFQNGGPSSSQVDMIVAGCFMQSVTFKMDPSSNGGQLVADITWWTSHVPVNGSLTPSSITDGGDESANIFNIAATGCSVDSQHLMLLGWDLALSKTLARAGWQEGTSSTPWGICQTGVTEVTGNLTAKRDDNTYALADHLLGDSAGVALSLTFANPTFTVTCAKTLINASAIDAGGEYLYCTLPFRAVAEDSSRTADVLSVTSA